MDKTAVIFDLFGTLVDSSPRRYLQGRSITSLMAEALQVDFSSFSEAWQASRVQTWQSTPDRVAWAALRAGSRAGSDRIDEATRIRLQLTQDWLQPCADVRFTLRELRGCGVPLGLISNCEIDVQETWVKCPLAEFFPAPILSCECGLRKPDQEVFQLAAEELRILPERCIFVDDRVAYLRGAEKVGMRAIRMQWSDPEQHHHSSSGAEPWDGRQMGLLSDLLRIMGNC